jgi:hypothetical protein
MDDKIIPVFRTPDGEVHETKQAARNHLRLRQREVEIENCEDGWLKYLIEGGRSGKGLPKNSARLQNPTLDRILNILATSTVEDVQHLFLSEPTKAPDEEESIKKS